MNSSLLNITSYKFSENIARIICYPSKDESCYFTRIKELISLRIGGILSYGSVQIGKIRVLGKGHTSIVFVGLRDGYRVAIKVLRLDSDRQDARHEAGMIKLANSVGVGPKLICYSKNFIVYEYIDGVPLGRWLRATHNLRIIMTVVRDVLYQAWRLDLIGLIHYELSNPEKHVIIERRTLHPYIIDFEASSLHSSKSNLTQLVQYFLVNPYIKIDSILELRRGVSRDMLLRCLRAYKRAREWRQFKAIMDTVFTSLTFQ